MESEAKVTLTLLVYSYSDLSAYRTRKIRERIVFIFEDAGIRINWLNCSTGLDNLQAPPTCRQSPGPSDLVLRLVEQAAPSKARCVLSPVARSIASERGGWYATVYCSTAKALAQGDRNSENEILAHAMAHEIGHLLLGAKAHANSGVMKAQWTTKDLSQMVKTIGLLFSADQAKKLRMCLLDRQSAVEWNQSEPPCREFLHADEAIIGEFGNTKQQFVHGVPIEPLQRGN